jgi:hypothetical protein
VHEGRDDGVSSEGGTGVGLATKAAARALRGARGIRGVREVVGILKIFNKYTHEVSIPHFTHTLQHFFIPYGDVSCASVA